jgi:hypothetical protein
MASRRTDAQQSKDAGLLAILAVTGLLFFIVISAPGLVALSLVKDIFGLTIYPDTMWQIAIVINIGLILSFRPFADSWGEVLLLYVLICVFIAMILAGCWFMFDAAFVLRWWHNVL